MVNDGYKSIGNDRLMYGLACRLTYQYTVQSIRTSKSLVGLDEQLKKNVPRRHRLTEARNRRYASANNCGINKALINNNNNNNNNNEL